MSQTAAIISYMQAHPARWLSQLDALDLFATTRLAARIQDAEALGHEFETRDIRNGRKHWREYRLRGPVQRSLFAEASANAG